MHTPSLLPFLCFAFRRLQVWKHPLKFDIFAGGPDVRGLRESACGHNHAELQRKKSRCMRRHYLDDQLATENPDLGIAAVSALVVVRLGILRHDAQLGSE